MADWVYYVHDSKTGEPLGEVDLRKPKVVDRLSETSTLTGTLSLDDPKCRRAWTGCWTRELTAVRDGVVAMHGPITARRRSRNSRELDLTASSPHAYFKRRVTEHARNYNREQFSIVRSLCTDAMAKTGGNLYRVVLGTSSSGKTVRLSVGGTERLYVADVIEDLAEDADIGFDFRWDYTIANAAGPTQHNVTRYLTLGYPAIGRDLSLSRVIEDNWDLDELTDEEDGSTAANRVHLLGAGTGTKRLRAVGNSGASLNAGYPLLETVLDRSEVKEQARLDGMAKHAVQALKPGQVVLSTVHRISPSLPYGAVDLGDTVRVKTTLGGDTLDLRRRVVVIETDPEKDTVQFAYFSPQDEEV